MRPRLSLFAERLFAPTHVALRYLISALQSRWDLALHASTPLPAESGGPSVQPIPNLDEGALAALVARSDIVHWLAGLRALDVGQALERACSRAGVPFVVGLGGSEVHEISTAGPRARDLARLLNGARLAVVATEEQRRLLLASGLGATRVAAAPLGIPTARYPVVSRHRESPFVVGFVGRLTPRKNVLAAFAAFARLAAAQPESRFVAIGSGPDRAALEQAVAAARLEAVCDLSETLPHARMLERLRGFSVLCCPAAVDERSRASGLPFVALESQASGVPVVGARSGGLVAGVVHGETGLLTTTADPDELAAALLRLSRDPDWRDRLGSAGRRWVERELDLDRVASLHDDLYRSLLNDPEGVR